MKPRMLEALSQGGINLQRKEVEDTEMEQIASECTDNTRIQTINLAYNHLTHEGVQQLARVRWHCLVSLNLCTNRLGPKGSKYLTQAGLKALEFLNLNECELGDVGVVHLAKARLPVLELLHLESNRLTGDSLRQLSKPNCPRITYVSLWHNSLRSRPLLGFMVYIYAHAEVHIHYDFWKIDSFESHEMRVPKDLFTHRSHIRARLP